MKKIFLTLLILCMSAISANATTLPIKLTQYVREQVPNAQIRFDGLITFPDKTTYIPLIPAIETPVVDIEPTYTYPSNSSLKGKAEIIVFNNNYVFMKVIKDKNGVTFSKIANYPMAVKAGMLPQDMLVPKGLYIPEVLEGILGDLKIPVGIRNNTAIKKPEEPQKSESAEFLDKANPITIPKINALRNKWFFITNYDSDFIRVINSDTTQPMYSLKLDSIPRSVTPVGNKYLMITTGGKTYLDVVDVQREEVAKQIDLTIEPSEVVVDNQNNLAYVGAKDQNAIFVIDTKTMELKRKVMVKGAPYNMAVNDDGSKVVYQDRDSAMLYVMFPKEEFQILSMTVIPNVSKIIAARTSVYAISRTQNQLKVMAYPSTDPGERVLESPTRFRGFWEGPNKPLPAPVENIIMAQKPVSEKPVDMIYYNNKLYILGAKQNQLNVYDTTTNEMVKTVDLPIGGFSKKLTQVDKTNYVIISNAREEKYLIYDLNTNSTVQQVPLNTKINNLVIIEKIQGSAL